MQREHLLIPSQTMGRPMHMWRYGHFGAPILVFPSASGMAHEWDAHGMIESLAGMIERGKIKLYCVESNVAEAWTRKEGDPRWRIQRHMLFEHYIVHELVPYIRADCRSEQIRIAACGTSLGAFYSANSALKFPEIFHYALCMSGRYNVAALLDGFSNPDVYFNNPLAYLPDLDGEPLEAARKNTHLALVCGRGKWEDGNIEETHALADLLQAKAISHERDLWGLDVSHAWDWWRRQAKYHLTKTFDR